MDNHINKKMFRLASMIYSDEAGEETRENILEKIISSTFLEKNNERMFLEEILDMILKVYKIEFSDDEVEKILKKKDNKFLLFKKKYQLSDKEYLKLKNERTNEIDIIKSKFYDIQKEKINEKELSKILDKFFYYIINLSIYQVNDLINKSKIDKEMENKFSEFEIEIIDTFLKWNNIEKDKIIFKMYNLGIEYSLLTLPDKNFDFLKCIKDKVLYLDCNVLYRALGLNGENRKKSINTLLEKCAINQEKLIISNATYEEFERTFEYHTKKIEIRERGEKLERILLQKFFQEGTIYYSFYEWKEKRKSANSVNNFRFEVKQNLKELLNTYNIKIEEMEELEKEDVNKLEKLEAEILQYTSEKNEANLRTDALNLYIISEKRKKNNENLEMENFYILSADKSLLPLRYKNRPYALYPSQWLSILLKYTGRTEDDFNSFKEFVKVSGSKEVLDTEKTYAIVDGIMRCVKELEAGEEFADYLIEKKIFEKANLIEITEIETIIVAESECFLEEKIKKLETNYEEQVEKKKSELERSYETKLEKEKNNIEELLRLEKEKSEEKNKKENAELKKKLEEEIIKKDSLKKQIEKERLKREKIKKIFKIIFSIIVVVIILFLSGEHILLGKLKLNPLNLIYLFNKVITNDNRGTYTALFIPLDIALILFIIKELKEWCKKRIM